MDFLRRYGLLLVVSGMLAAFQAAYVVVGLVPSPAAQSIARYSLPVCFALWVQADSRARRCTPCFDFGAFVLFTWAVSVPWYLFWTRGWQGLPIALMFFGALIFPGFVAIFVWNLRMAAGGW